MESLADKKDGAAPQPKGTATSDRVTLTKPESERLGGWLGKIKSTSNGFLALTKSDLVNFLIRAHKLELSPREIAQIRSAHYDPIRHMNWITQELKRALSKSDMDAVTSLQSEIKGIELMVNPGTNSDVATRPGTPNQFPAKRKRGKRQNDSSDSAPRAESEATTTER